jgi:hypothetical protein
MKKILFIVISIFIFSLQAEKSFAQVITLDYGDYNGQVIYLELDFNEATVLLKTPIDFWETGDESLLLLKEKVIDIFSSAKAFQLGDYSLRCTGFYPVYKPVKGFEGKDRFQYLLFSEDVEMLGSEILIKGEYSDPKDCSYFPQIEVGEDNFKRLFEFIQKEGGKYSFIDSRGNLHVFILIYQDEEAYQITVYGYHGGIRNQKNFFPYIIYRQEIYFSEGNLYPLKNIRPIKLGYEEFVNFVK